MSLFAVSCLFFSSDKAGLSNASWKVVKSHHLSNHRIEVSSQFFQKFQTENINERNTQGLYYPQPAYRFILNTILFPPNRVWRGIGVEAINHPNFRISFPPASTAPKTKMVFLRIILVFACISSTLALFFGPPAKVKP